MTTRLHEQAPGKAQPALLSLRLIAAKIQSIGDHVQRSALRTATGGELFANSISGRWAA